MSEFRQDIVSGDWIISAPERARRPHDFLPAKNHRHATPVQDCPFEDLRRSGNWPPVASYPNETDWQAVIIQNKFPALLHEPACASIRAEGPYKHLAGIGHHDVAITRDHNLAFGQLDPQSAFHLLKLVQERYLYVARDRCLEYASTFFNWGPGAGASLYHPHYQILSLPIIPPDVEHSLEGSKRYLRRTRRCVHCDTIRFERRYGKRIICANRFAVAFAPFASRSPFEVRVFPLRHESFFEYSPPLVLKGIVEILQDVLRRIAKNLNDPDLNFFIHTAPLKKQKRYGYYHWHIEVIPKINVPGGFELSTGVDINVVDPDMVSEIVRPV